MRAAFRKLVTLTPLAWGFFVGSVYAQETPYYNPATGGYYQSRQEACVSAIPAVTGFLEANASSSRAGQTVTATYAGYALNYCQYTYTWSGGGGGTGAMNTSLGTSAAHQLSACSIGEVKTSSVPVGRLIDGVYTDFGSYYTSKKCYSGCEAVFNGGGGITYVTPGDGNNYVYEDLEYELTGASCSADSADPSFSPPESPNPEPDPEPETPTDPEPTPDPDDGGGTGGTGGGTGGGSGGSGGGSGGGGGDPTDPTDPTYPTDPTDPSEPSDPTDPADPGDTSGPQDGATSADIRSLGDRITGAISSAYDRLASAISGVRNDLQGMNEAIEELSGPEWGADGGLDDGSGIGEMGGELGGGIVEGINTATDDAIASRDGELQEALDGIAGQVEDWFGDKGSKIDPDNLLGFLPREASCSDIPISVKLGREDANLVIPVCSLSSVKDILKWVFYALTIIGIWKILMNGMIVSARGGKGR